MLMFSVSEIISSGLTGIILSGQHHDGAEGLEEINRLGGKTIILDPAECMHEDMVRYSMKLNQSTDVMPMADIISTLNDKTG